MSQNRIMSDAAEDDIIEVSDDVTEASDEVMEASDDVIEVSDDTLPSQESADDMGESSPDSDDAGDAGNVGDAEPTEASETEPSPSEELPESDAMTHGEGELDDLVSTLFEETLRERGTASQEDGASAPPPPGNGSDGGLEAESDVASGIGSGVDSDDSSDDEDMWDDGDSVPYARAYGVTYGGDDDRYGLVTMSQETTVIADMPAGMSQRHSPVPKRRRHDPKAPEDGRYRVSVGGMVACLLVGLAIGVLVTFIVTSEVGKGAKVTEDDGRELVSGTVAADALDAEMVRYSYGDDEVSLSVRDVITMTGSLESMRDEATKRYSVPSAEKALEAVRNDIVRRDAERHGIEVTDGDVLGYVSDTYGVATVDELSQQVGLSDEETERQLRERLVIKFLKEDVVGEKELLPLVEPPAPDDGDPETLNGVYAAYIINLAGDEWDVEGNRWRSDESAFAKALADTPFDGGLASYDMARKAYDVVRQRNEEIQRTIDGAWSDYINDMFRQATVTLSGASR